MYDVATERAVTQYRYIAPNGEVTDGLTLVAARTLKNQGGGHVKSVRVSQAVA